jgi:hypothetical protein
MDKKTTRFQRHFDGIYQPTKAWVAHEYWVRPVRFFSIFGAVLIGIGILAFWQPIQAQFADEAARKVSAPTPTSGRYKPLSELKSDHNINGQQYPYFVGDYEVVPASQPLRIDTPGATNETVDIKPAHSEISSTEISDSVQIRADNNQTIVEPKANKPRAGLFTVTAKNPNGTVLKTETKAWGVLAFNPDYAVYPLGAPASLAMAVLDDRGKMICDADMRVEITDPIGNKKILTTDDNGGILVNEDCFVYGQTDAPDYAAAYQPGPSGTYQVLITARIGTGRRTLHDQFSVANNQDIYLERNGATRLYPPVPYEYTLTVHPAVTGSMTITEKVPASFEIFNTKAVVTANDDHKTLTWHEEAVAGEPLPLTFHFRGPNVSPYLFLFDPVTVELPTKQQWVEPRSWLLASDNACVSNVASGNWATSGSWTSCGGTTPQAADSVAIANGHTITLNTGPTILTIDIQNGGTLTNDGNARTLTLALTTGTGFTKGATGTFTPSTFITVSFTSNANFTVTSGTITFYNLTFSITYGSNTRTFTMGTGAITINNNWSITGNKSGGVNGPTFTITMAAAVTVSNALSITATGGVAGQTNTVNLDTTGSNHALTAGSISLTDSSNNAATLTANASIITLTGTSGTLFTRGTGTFTQGTSEVKVTSASGTPTLLSGATTFHKLTINSAATSISAGAAITMSSTNSANKLYIQSGVLDDGGNQITGTSNGTLVIDSGGTLKLGSTSTATTFPTNYTNGNITLDTASTVTYQANATQTISEVPTYGNLSCAPTLSSSGKTYTFGGATTINGDFTINPTAASGLALTVNPAGTITVATGKTTTISGSGAGPATSTLDLRPASTDYNLSTGLLNIGANGTLDAASSVSVITLKATSGTLFTRSGTFTQGTSDVQVTSASGTPTLLSAATTFHKLTLNTASTSVAAGAAITMSNASAANKLDIQQGTLDDGGNQIAGTANGTMSMSSGTTLKLGSGTATTFPTNYTNGNITLNAASTVVYNSTTTQTISGTPTYGHLQLSRASGTPTKTAGANLDVNGNLTIDSSNTLDMSNSSNFSLNLAGNYTNNGTFTARAGTVTFDATATGKTLNGTMTGSSAFYIVDFNGSGGGWTLAAAFETTNNLSVTAGTFSTDTTNGYAVTAGGNVTIASGTTFDANGSTVTVSGNWAQNNTTWNTSGTGSDTSTVVLNGTSKTLTTTGTAAGDRHFYNLTINGSYAKTSGNRVNIYNNFIMNNGSSFTGIQYSPGGLHIWSGSATVTINGTLSKAGSNDGSMWIRTSMPTITSSSGIGVRVDYLIGTTGTHVIPALNYAGGLLFLSSENNTYQLGSGTFTIGGTDGGWTMSNNTSGKTLTVDNTANNSTVNVTDNIQFPSDTGSVSMSMGSASYSVGNSWTNTDGAAITPGTSTVTFSNDTDDGDITSASQTFYNVIINDTGDDITPIDALSITNDLTLTAGELNSAQNVTVNGNVAGTAGFTNFSGGTFTQRVAANKNFGTTSGTTAWVFSSLTFSNSHASSPFTITTQTGGTGGITVTGVLRVGASGDASGATTTLNAGNRTWTLSSTAGDPFQLLASPAALLSGGTSKFYYTGANGSGNTTIQASASSYYDLEINASDTFVLEGDTLVANDLTITTGTLDTTGSNYALTAGRISIASSQTLTANASTITLTGTSGTLLTRSGTFTQGTSTVAVTSASGTPTLLSAATTFHILTINSAATVINAGAAITTDNGAGNKLYIQSGVFNIEGNTITPGTSGTLQVDSGGTLCLGGTTGSTSASCNSGATQTGSSTFPAFTTITLDASSTVIFLADVAQTVTNSPTYGNLKLMPTLTAARTYTFGGAMTINGNFTVQPTRSSAALLTVNAAGNITVAATKSTLLTRSSSATTTLDLRPSSTDYNLSTGDLDIEAGATLDLTSASSTVTIALNYTNNGTLTAGTSSVIFTATTTGKTLSGTLSSTSAFYDLTFNGSGGEWTPGAAVLVTHDLTMTAGSLLGTQNVTVNRHVAGTAGIINLTGGTFEHAAGSDVNFGTTSGSAAWTFYDLTFSYPCSGFCADGGITVTTQTGGTGGITVSDVMKIGKSGDGDITTLNAGNRTWTLSGTAGDPFQILASPAGVLTANTSTFNYTGANGGGNTTVQSATYYNLTINASDTFVLEGTTSTNNDLTITSGTLDTVSGQNYAINIKGNYSNSGTFSAQSGTVTFTATDTGNTLSGTLSGSSTFYNLIFNGSGGEWTPSATVGVGNDLTVTAGTLLGTQNITVAGGDATGNGTVNLTGGTFTITGTGNFGGDTGWTFNNLAIGASGGSASTITATGTGGMTVGVNLSITARFSGTNTLQAGSKIWTLSGTSGTPFCSAGALVGASLTAQTSEFRYTGNNSGGNTTVCGQWSYYKLTINNGSETFDMAANTTATNNLTITAGTLDATASNRTLTVGGNFANAGTFTPRSGTVTLNGSAQQTVSDTNSGTNTFYALTLTNASGTSDPGCGGTFSPGVIFSNPVTTTNTFTITTASVKVRYNSGSTYAFNNINWNGQAAGTRLEFCNSNLGSGTWSLNVTASGNAQTKVSYVNVARSDASTGSTIIASDGTNVDSSNNTNWQFDETLTLSLDSTSKSFGVIQPGSNPSDQTTTLTATSNSSTGYVIYAWCTQAMTETRGYGTISDWTGTNATPTTFSNPSTGFGYTTDDASLTGGTANRFTNGGAKYAGFTHTGPGDPVADRTSASTSVTNTISYRLYPSATAANGDYTTTVVYIIAAAFP